jgi:hypothetical protein
MCDIVCHLSVTVVVEGLHGSTYGAAFNTPPYTSSTWTVLTGLCTCAAWVRRRLVTHTAVTSPASTSTHTATIGTTTAAMCTFFLRLPLTNGVGVSVLPSLPLSLSGALLSTRGPGAVPPVLLLGEFIAIVLIFGFANGLVCLLPAVLDPASPASFL